MSISLNLPRAEARRPRLLVVDDDRRVLELLQIALSASGFDVSVAVDGEEAIKRALAERPDLVVLDVRLPRKSGLEVCDFLRHDPEDPHVPVILISAAADTESRLEGLARGADDYLAKPFSPKELVARVKRLLARAGTARDALRRNRELERELARSQDEVKRTHAETSRERRLRELAFGLGRELHMALDEDDLTRRFLLAVQAQLRVGVTALLTRARGSDGYVAAAVRGDGFERISGLELRAGGELESLLKGLGRPVLRHELERFPELREELAPLIAHGFTLVAPLRGQVGLVALLLADDRPDGQAHDAADLDSLAGLCEIAAVALHNAQAFRIQAERVLDLVAQRRLPVAGRESAIEAEALARRAARALQLPPRERWLLERAAVLSVPGITWGLMSTLRELEAQDPTARIAELRRMLERAGESPAAASELASGSRRALDLLRVTRRFAVARSRGHTLETALGEVLADGEALDSATLQALRDACRAGAAEIVT